MLIPRRQVLQSLSATAAALLGRIVPAAPSGSKQTMKLGLVTYNWGKNWDIPTIIRNCAKTGFLGVELRSTHKHGVEITLGKNERQQVRKQFEDSPIELMGLGSACEYHAADPKIVEKNVEQTKAFVKLCHDVGGTGVKVRPNGFPKNVPHEQTLEQIGRALNKVARFGADYGVAIRLEVHGHGTCELPHIAKIMEFADHPNAVVCWNCNPTDLIGDGLESNFRLVEKRIGTVHIHDLRSNAYPWAELFRLLHQARFTGWTLLEEGKVPEHIVDAMHQNKTIWDKLANPSS